MGQITRSRVLRLFAGACLGLFARADVTLPPQISDHMVVQRGLPVHIQGKAAPGEPGSVSFRNQNRGAVADDLGLWSVYLPASAAGGPFTLSITGSNTLTVQDVMVGEVWVDSGQSNMEFALRGAHDGAAEVAAASRPNIRLLHVNRKVSAFPLMEADARRWELCTPRTAGSFTAVGYFFAREVSERLGIAVGLMGASWGGTPVEAWMSLRAL